MVGLALLYLAHGSGENTLISYAAYIGNLLNQVTLCINFGDSRHSINCKVLIALGILLAKRFFLSHDNSHA